MTGDIPTFLLALGAFLTGFAALWGQRRGSKTDEASNASTLTNTATGLVESLRTEVDRLQKVIGDLSNLVSALESEIVVLGGDPSRIRLEVSRMNRRLTDRTDIEGNPI